MGFVNKDIQVKVCDITLLDSSLNTGYQNLHLPTTAGLSIWTYTKI
jgi:hypothetical protein